MDGQKKKQLGKKKYVRYPEGAELYSMGLSKFQQIAKDAKAIYKVARLVLVNTARLLRKSIMSIICMTVWKTVTTVCL